MERCEKFTINLFPSVVIQHFHLGLGQPAFILLLKDCFFSLHETVVDNYYCIELLFVAGKLLFTERIFKKKNSLEQKYLTITSFWSNFFFHNNE